MFDLFFIIILLVCHAILIFLFASSFYVAYFVALVIMLYFIHRCHRTFSLKKLFVSVVLLVSISNLDIYDEYLFESLFYFDLLDKVLYLNREVVYTLGLAHFIFLVVIKKIKRV
jgi:hypothetical protein